MAPNNQTMILVTVPTGLWCVVIECDEICPYSEDKHYEKNTITFTPLFYGAYGKRCSND